MTNTCPRCRRSFRVPEDESGEHNCPHCNYGPDDWNDVQDIKKEIGIDEEEDE